MMMLFVLLVLSWWVRFEVSFFVFRLSWLSEGLGVMCLFLCDGILGKFWFGIVLSKILSVSCFLA